MVRFNEIVENDEFRTNKTVMCVNNTCCVSKLIIVKCRSLDVSQ